MACNPTRLELSNSATTTVQVTIATDPGDGTAVTLQVDELSIDQSQTTSSGVATFTITAVSAANNSIWDATIQVGSNSIAAASVQVVETNVAQTVGVTVSDADVTYCAPTGGGGGTGDAVKANPLSQFAEVNDYGTPEDGMVLSRKADSGEWQVTRRSGMQVDRRPLMFAHYADQTSAPDGWGNPTQNDRRTPNATPGDSAYNDPAQNGQWYFTNRKFLALQDTSTTPVFERYHIGTISGHLTGGTNKGFIPLPVSFAQNLPDAASTYDNAGSPVTSYPCPFTTDGLPLSASNSKGNLVESWKAAIGLLRTNVESLGGKSIEVSNYVGWNLMYDDAARTQYNTTLLALNNDWDDSNGKWVDPPRVSDIIGRMATEYALQEDLGFSSVNYDLGRPVWEQGEGRSLIDAIERNLTVRPMFEAVPRSFESGSLGKQLYDPAPYENGRYMVLFPTIATIDGESHSSTIASAINVDEWLLDPARTEVHIVFQWAKVANTSQMNLTGARIRELMDIAHSRGFVVSVDTGTFPAATSDGWTRQEFTSYAQNLYQKSIGLIPASAGTGTVTSVGLTMPTGFTVTGSPVTSSGTLGVTWDGNADTVTGPMLFTARNVSGGTMTKGQVVYISGHSGTESEVDLADADDATAMPAFGLVNSATVPNNAEVEIVTFGEIIGMNTNAFNVGDVVYVHTTPGELTATPPTGESSLIQNMGKVVRKHATEGIIKVIGAGRTNATPNLDQDKVFLGNASNQAVSTALSAIGLSKFNDDLPAVSDSYLMLIESPADKSGPGHVIDGRVAAARTIVSLYARTAAGSCTVTLSNVTSTPATVIASVNASVTGATNTSPSNTSVSENDRLAIAISSSSGTPEDLEIVVEYTQ